MRGLGRTWWGETLAWCFQVAFFHSWVCCLGGRLAGGGREGGGGAVNRPYVGLATLTHLLIVPSRPQGRNPLWGAEQPAEALEQQLHAADALSLG